MPYMPALPDHATRASQTRFDLALQLADNCPHQLAAAIALTGSSQKAIADAEAAYRAGLRAQ